MRSDAVLPRNDTGPESTHDSIPAMLGITSNNIGQDFCPRTLRPYGKCYFPAACSGRLCSTLLRSEVQSRSLRDRTEGLSGLLKVIWACVLDGKQMAGQGGPRGSMLQNRIRQQAKDAGQECS